MTSAVKKLRQAMLLTQSELASKLGVCRQMIAAYENNSSIPRFNIIKKIICLAGEVDPEINITDFYAKMLSEQMNSKNVNNSKNKSHEIIDCDSAKENLGWPNRIKDRASLVKLLTKADLIKFYGSCCICGWNEGVIDMAHIGEHRKGFHFTYDNIVPLCPNHHRLFDRNLFNENEKEKIRDFILNISKGIEKYKLEVSAND